MLRSLIAPLAALALAAGASLALAQGTTPSPGAKPGEAVATFAAGCFWCTEADYDKVPGVLKTVSGFMGGTTPNPTYEQVVTGRTGHAESVQVTYDPAKVSYEKLLEVYWRNVDPFDAKGQFCDKGSHYRPVIFAHTPEQRGLAQASKEDAVKRLASKFKFPVVVEIVDASTFTPAEEYHQDFYKKNAAHYSRYRTGCGRDFRLEQIWGKQATQ